MLDNFNKILLPQGIEESFMRFDSPFSDEEVQFSFDKGSYNYLFEELISRGAINMVLQPDSGYLHHLDSYEGTLKKRTFVADKKRKALDSLAMIFKPVAEELSIDISQCTPHSNLNYQRSIVTAEKNFIRRQQLISFAIAYENVYPFIIGIRENVQISLDIEKTINSLAALKSFCKNETSRTNCAMLLGLLGTYKPIEIPSIQIHKSSAPFVLVNNFKYFLRDELYREYSFHASSLGKIKVKAREATDNMERALLKFIKGSKYGEGIDFGTKIITKSTGIPIPSYKIAESLLQDDSFLPPIIKLSDIVLSARENWADTNTPFGYIDGFGGDILDDALGLQQQELTYTFGTDKERIKISFLVKGRFYGKEVGFQMIPDQNLNNEMLEAFKQLHNQNFSTAVLCILHNSVTNLSNLTLKYTVSKVDCRFRACCSENYFEILTKLLPFKKNKE